MKNKIVNSKAFL